MRTLLTFCFLLAALLPLHAQDELYKYDRIPDEFQQVFNDVGRECATVLMNAPNGQYWGQARNGMLYGYGIYSWNNGSQWVGQFREGKYIFALLLNDSTACIGSPSFYVVYDLKSCALKHIRQNGVNTVPDPELSAPYRFEALNYANGDRYVGETYKGERWGYGIYYWSDGRFWFGQYRHNVRDGYGVLFGTDHKIVVGKWSGNDLKEMEW